MFGDFADQLTTFLDSVLDQEGLRAHAVMFQTDLLQSSPANSQDFGQVGYGALAVLELLPDQMGKGMGQITFFFFLGLTTGDAPQLAGSFGGLMEFSFDGLQDLGRSRFLGPLELFATAQQG